MFLKSISCWSFPTAPEKTEDYAEMFRKAKSMGYDAVEVAVAPEGALTPDSGREQCRAITGEARKAGIKIASVATGIYWEYSLSSGDQAKRRKAIACTKKMLRITSWLGADTLLVIPGAVHVPFDPKSEIVPYDTVWKRTSSAVRQCLRVAREVKVSMALENVWNKFLLSPLEMKAFVDQFKSRYVGVYFDVGNAVQNGFPEQWIRLLGKRIKRVHLKDFKWRFLFDVNGIEGFKGFAKGQGWGSMAAFCDLGSGDVNWPEVISALRKIKYSGPLTAEMLPPDEKVARRTSRAIDRILAKQGKAGKTRKRRR